MALSLVVSLHAVHTSTELFFCFFKTLHHLFPAVIWKATLTSLILQMTRMTYPGSQSVIQGLGHLIWSRFVFTHRNRNETPGTLSYSRRE